MHRDLHMYIVRRESEIYVNSYECTYATVYAFIYISVHVFVQIHVFTYAVYAPTCQRHRKYGSNKQEDPSVFPWAPSMPPYVDPNTYQLHTVYKIGAHRTDPQESKGPIQDLISTLNLHCFNSNPTFLYQL